MQTDTQRGFSLLEAIVALVILAGSCMALFAGSIAAWCNCSEQNFMWKPAGHRKRQSIPQNGRSDPAARGSFQSGRVAVDWAAKPIELEVSRPSEYGGSNFLLSLYQVSLTAHTPDRSLPSLQTRIVNYRLKPGLPDPNDGL